MKKLAVYWMLMDATGLFPKDFRMTKFDAKRHTVDMIEKILNKDFGNVIITDVQEVEEADDEQPTQTPLRPI